MNLIIEKSTDVFRLVLALGLLFCIGLVVIEVLVALGGDAESIALMDERLTPVLLLAGVLITAFLVVRIENALAISISVLIIGTVVAGDRFLLSITALLTNNDGDGGQFVREFYAGQPGEQLVNLTNPESIQQLTDQLLQAIEVSQEKDDPAAAAVVVEDYITRARVSQIAADVTNFNAQQPLLVLLRSSADAAAFFLANQANPVLRENMLFLRSNGLVFFTRPDYADARLTDMGTEVARALNRPFEVIEPVVVIEESPEPTQLFQDLDLDALARVDVGQGEVITPLEWDVPQGEFVALEILTDDIFIIETTDPGPVGLDTVIDLLNDQGESVKQDDDGGDDGLSRMIVELAMGTYYLNVRSFSGDAGRVALSIRN
ncbi:MAG: hypothetical protein AAFN63_18705 [Pseudomonadota bacterium]